MILVARNVAEALADYATMMEQTPLMQAAHTLPGYATYESAIESQYEMISPGEVQAEAQRRERTSDLERAD